ncbi:MAG: fumarylacetoacetate hydrolase family protein [Thermaerobacter sp.]|nr:fumarylacetoacetate hydrolase family protein [Thermaerobacter sp.]
MAGPIRLIRWKTPQGQVRLGVSAGDDAVVAVDAILPGVCSVQSLRQHCRTQSISVAEWAAEILQGSSPRVDVSPDSWLAPLTLSELWAAGVTYEISRDAREQETTSAQNFYARIYESHRPELFFKAPGSRVAGPGDFVGLRRDATWHVPEPEMTVVLDDTGQVFGFTAGNDMTARDVEAQNPLYLPQAKMFHHAAAIGPSLVLAGTVDPYDLTITLAIRRKGQTVFQGATTTQKLRRSVEELVEYLGRALPLAPWTGLMTGTGIVPPDSFSVEDGDDIFIDISSIGTLYNRARIIGEPWVSVPTPPPRVVRIHPGDNVAVTLGGLERGQRVRLGNIEVTVQNAIPFGHKLALGSIPQGGAVIKYGEIIGLASCPIEPGEHVHIHNLESRRGRGDLASVGK